MSNSENMGQGLLAILFTVGTIISWIFWGVVVWDWVNPDGFGSFILFVIIWGLLSKTTDAILTLLMTFIYGYLFRK